MIKRTGETCVCLKTILHIDSEQRIFLKNLKQLFWTGNMKQNCGPALQFFIGSAEPKCGPVLC